MRSFDRLFCLGLQKTGTSSLIVAHRILGLDALKMVSEAGQVTKGQMFYDMIRHLVHHHETRVWADTPFYWFPLDLKLLFPKALFILTVRDSTDQWIESFQRHFKGQPGAIHRAVFGNFSPTRSPEIFTDYYENHNEFCREIFKGSDRFLEFNVGQGWGPLCEFLDVNIPDDDFPHLNRYEDESLED